MRENLVKKSKNKTSNAHNFANQYLKYFIKLKHFNTPQFF